MSNEQLSLGMDVGGTWIKVGLVAADGAVVRTLTRPSPGRGSDPARAIDCVVDVISELLVTDEAREHGVGAVGVGAAGFVDAERGLVVFAPHLPWREERLADEISHLVGRPVLVDNDANAAAWAEHRFGAGRGESDLGMVTLGTGIGGALVLNGSLYRGRHGLAGEFGHMVVEPQGRPCACGNRGCWEQYASGGVLGRAAHDLVASRDAGAPRLVKRADKVGDELDGQDLTEAGRAGDPAAVEVLADVGRWLGLGLANLTAALDLPVLVVGGGASEAGELILAPARETLARLLPGAGHRPVPEVRAAQLGAVAGMIGAADLARHAAR